VHGETRPLNTPYSIPSRCLHSNILSASAPAVSSFHTAPFLFTHGDLWISCPIVSRAVRTSAISSLESGWAALWVSCCFSDDTRISAQVQFLTGAGLFIFFATVSRLLWGSPQLPHQQLPVVLFSRGKATGL
jgi:hypothetical protein